MYVIYVMYVMHVMYVMLCYVLFCYVNVMFCYVMLCMYVMYVCMCVCMSVCTYVHMMCIWSRLAAGNPPCYPSHPPGGSNPFIVISPVFKTAPDPSLGSPHCSEGDESY